MISKIKLIFKIFKITIIRIRIYHLFYHNFNKIIKMIKTIIYYSKIINIIKTIRLKIKCNKNYLNKIYQVFNYNKNNLINKILKMIKIK